MQIVVVFLILFFNIIYADIKYQPKVEIISSNILYLDNLIKASGDVVVLYDNTILQADRAVYNQKESTLELFGNVVAIHNTKYTLLSDYAKFYLTNENSYFSPIFLAEHKTKLWTKGKNAKKENNTITLRNALVSSCDVDCPAWRIQFSKLEYDENNSWLNIWNPLIYLGDVPVLYFPYIGFSVNRKRKSGFLYPTLKISSRDGFIYWQPIYFALEPTWDLELDLNFRNLRGRGVFATLRFVDSPYSNGSFTTGFFKNKSEYVNKYNIKNSSHYGYQFFYNSTNVFAKKDNLDGLYVDITYLKDPDYLNLQKKSIAELLYSSQVQSRINYYLETSNYYVGVYGKYFIDTALPNNLDTVQTLPIIQLHKYQNLLFGLSEVQYSADYRLSSFFTRNGEYTQLQEINLPLTFYGSLFEDLLKYSISENIYYAYIGYQNIDLSGKKSYYKFFRNYHKIDIYSDLAKKYSDFFHVLQLRATYNRPSFSIETGYIDPRVSVLRSPKENIVLSGVSYLYDFKGEEWLYHRISQPIYLEKSRYNYGDIENELIIKFYDFYEFYTNIFYSFYNNNIRSESSRIKYNDKNYDIMLTHFYKKTEEGKSDFFTLSGRIKLDNGNDWFASLAYDNIYRDFLMWEIGVQLFRGCWDVLLGLKSEKRPILTSVGAQSINNFAIHFHINLFPLGGISHNYEQRF